MEEQWSQTGPAIFVSLIILGAFFLLSVLALNVLPQWGFGIAAIPLLLAIPAYALLWHRPAANQPHTLDMLFYSAFASSPFLAVILLGIALARGQYFQYFQSVQVNPILFLLLLGCTASLLLTPALILWKRHQEGQQIFTSDQEKQEAIQFREALARRRTEGWGLYPEEARRQGRIHLQAGGILIVSDGLILFLVTRHFAALNGLGNPIYVIIMLGILADGLWLAYFPFRYGPRFTRSANAWRDQGEQVISVTGTLASFWQDNSLFNRYRNVGILIKLLLPDGNNQVLLVGPALTDQLPERAGTAVSIDYLPGCEAVIAIKTPVAGAF